MRILDQNSQLIRQTTAEATRREDKRQMERMEDLAWEKQRVQEKDTIFALNQAIRNFPKIKDKQLLPAQLQNFSDILEEYECPKTKRTCRLQEILEGPLAVTFQNLKLTNDVPFEKAKSQLLNAAGCTVSVAMKSLLRPDSEAVAAMSGLDLFNNAQSMVNRIATDDMTLKTLRFILLKGYLSNIVNEKCLAAISSNSVVTVEDFRDAVLGCYETYGAVVETTRNVAKYFARKSDLDTQRKMGTPGFRPSCSTCRRIGHRTSDCFYNSSWRDQRDYKTITCFSCKQQGHTSPNCPSKGNQQKEEISAKEKISAKNSLRVSTPDSMTSGQNVINIEVYNTTIPAVIDSGADITVWPKELVPKVARLDETVTIHSYDRNVKVREMAVVKITLGDVTLNEKVALASMVELGGKALLSLPLLNQDKRTVLLDALQKQKAVCAVQTRSMVEEEKNWML